MVHQSPDARTSAELAARESYGKLFASLSKQCRDLSLVEDALSDAFTEALERWPVTGVPAQPEAWLMVTSRRRLVDGYRRGGREASRLKELAVAFGRMRFDDESDHPKSSPDRALPDDRLELLFVCAHPAIDVAARAPLMLQTIFGLDAARIASAFLVPPATMSQRLVRAKTRIRDLKIPFQYPVKSELNERMGFVLAAIYASYGTGFDDFVGQDEARQGLGTEAIRLSTIIVDLWPDAPEPMGLLALLWYCEARKRARLDDAGCYVPLDQQDTSRWDWAMIGRAEDLLGRAAAFGTPGRFQLEAAIQSAHCARGAGLATDWRAIARLYDALLQVEPAIGVIVSRAAAIARAFGPDAALASLDGLPTDRVERYQPYWAVRASVLAKLGRNQEAKISYLNAIDLSPDPAIRAFLSDALHRLP